MQRIFVFSILSFISSIAFGRSADSEPSNEELLAAIKQSGVVVEYLKQLDLSPADLTVVQAPGTKTYCTMMMRDNSCSLSFRMIDSAGKTVMSGGLAYNGIKKAYSVFRILENAPAAGSDFEAFSKMP